MAKVTNSNQKGSKIMDNNYYWILCKKCGRMDFDEDQSKFPVCKFCKHEEVVKIPRDEYNDLVAKYHSENPSGTAEDWNDEAEEYYREKYVYHNNPDFDKVAYNEMLDYKRKELADALAWAAELDARLAGHPTITCPTCGSTNTKKISALSKGVSVGLFGIFSQKVKHQFHCNSCGYEW